MKTAHTPDTTTTPSTDEPHMLAFYARAWLAEHDQRIARRGPQLVHRQGNGPWRPVTAAMLADAITAVAERRRQTLDSARLVDIVRELIDSAPVLGDPAARPLVRLARILTRSIAPNALPSH